MSVVKAPFKHDHPDLRALIGAGGFPVRPDVWGMLGVWVGASPPSTPVVYADWVAGSTGYWCWIQLP